VIEFADILREYVRDYLEQYKENIPQSHLKVINDILVCRTKQNGGTTYYCKHCDEYIYSYHSCGNRNCNKCQHELADLWLEKSKEQLLKTDHFLVTFTLPDLLRTYCRSNQNLAYHLLFKTSSEGLQTIAYDTKYAGGKLGMIGFLHTCARDLSYHPHVHFLVTGGGLFEDENIWFSSKENFLVPVKALSRIFKAKFRDMLKVKNKDIFHTIPAKVWKKDWVVHSEPVGSGEKALSYLARYIFRPPISNNNILSLEKGVVCFRFRNAKTKIWQKMELPANTFIHRYLQHVLPKGFVKVRYYGLYAHAYKKKYINIPQKRLIKLKNENSNETNRKNNHFCPKCNGPLILVELSAKVYFYSNGPPKRKVLLKAIDKKLRTPIY
jgi:hypothetical protein